MKIKEVMTKDVEVIGPEASLREAAEKMRELDVGAIPVCEAERLVGVLTDRDIAVRAAAEGYDPNEVEVREVMTPDPVYCFEDSEIQEAADLMADMQIRRLPIVDQEEKLVGIVSLGDLALTDPNLSGQTLEGVSLPNDEVRV